MDSSEPTEAKDIPGATAKTSSADGLPNFARGRTESESSDRAQPLFVLPGTQGSPPKVMRLEEVQSAVKNIEDMALAHEIAINSEFRLQPYEPPENSLEKIVKDTIHKAFWDVLREQLNRDPPCFDHAIQLLKDIKEDFKVILPKNNQKALDRINEVLDETVIRQQAEQGVLDFKAYSSFVIHVMSLACAPVRDEQVAKLKEIADTVDAFRGILETLALMKLDMANCLLDAARNDVIANSVEYEKQKFKEYLEFVGGGLPATQAWLKRNVIAPNGTTDTLDPQRKSKDSIFNAYMELIDWNEENEFPEIISMDRDRIFGLQSRALRLCTCASAFAIASGVPAINQSTETKNSLAKQLEILLANLKTEKDLEDTLENVWLHIKSVIDARLKELNQAGLDEATANQLKSHVIQIAKKDSPVRSLLWKRFLAYIRLILRSNHPVPPPPGFSEYAEELSGFAVAFKRVTYYNYAVYGEYYHEILSKFNALVPTATTPGDKPANELMDQSN